MSNDYKTKAAATEREEEVASSSSTTAEGTTSTITMGIMTIFKCFTGPTLYKRYKSFDNPGRHYSPNFLESKADLALWAASALRTFCLYISPILVSYLYSRGYLTVPTMGRTLFYVGSFYGITYIVRGVGRIANTDYFAFLRVLQRAQQNPSPANMRALREFDSEFWAWPVNYRWLNTMNGKRIERRYIPTERIDPGSNAAWKWTIHSWLCSFAANTFAGWMIYPGHLRLFNILLHETLTTKRKEMVEVHKGQRSKLARRSGQDVDCMFIDRRNQPKFTKGNTLIITSEGNAGYYEIGCMETAIKCGYSVLGWNHPGFGGSTGSPWPRDDAEGIDVVVQYAIRQLGFEEEDIIFFAWSIGGYTASWAAMNYERSAGLMLDATFDDVLPLALPRMPKSLGSLVKRTIREYWDLPILKQSLKYQGPITLIRRTKDEIIVTDESSKQSMVSTNRCKYLLFELLQFRYPFVMEGDMAKQALFDFFDDPSNRDNLLRGNHVEEDECVQILKDALKRRQDDGEKELFPLTELGPDLSWGQRRQLILFLASKYMKDYDSGHANPLPNNLLSDPKHPWE